MEFNKNVLCPDGIVCGDIGDDSHKINSIKISKTTEES